MRGQSGECCRQPARTAKPAITMMTAVLEGSLVRVVSWYDNEWGYPNRRVELAKQGPVHAHA